MLDMNNPVLEFTAHDRCDKCRAQAVALSKRDDMPSELLFCFHCYKEYKFTLENEGWDVVEDFIAISKLLGDKEYAGV